MEIDPQILEAFHSSGYRLTHQRQLVLQVLAESDEHLDAETVYLQAKSLDPRISMATVYRTLSFLKEMGVVTEHQLGQNHGHFESADASPHYHFTCLSCGKVIEFPAPQVIQIAEQLSDEHGLSITEMHLLFSGTCAQCSSKSRSDKPVDFIEKVGA